MIAQPRVVKREEGMSLKSVGHVGFAYRGVFSVVAASTTMSMKKLFVWSGFVQIVVSSYLSPRTGKMERMVFLKMVGSRT